MAIRQSERKQEAERKELFVQTLFNRLMFVYFLSRKGWLTFQDDNDYLNALWADLLLQARPGRRQLLPRPAEAPLLLRAEQPAVSRPELPRPATCRPCSTGTCRSVSSTVGCSRNPSLTGAAASSCRMKAIEPILTELFDRFNFTVMESTPFDVEVAVDPEMLGKVFEETVNDRHDTGSYYTPRLRRLLHVPRGPQGLPRRLRHRADDRRNRHVRRPAGGMSVFPL